MIIAGVKEGVDALLRGKEDRENSTILNWLTPIDYGPQQIDLIGRREAGTGEWLLKSKEFKKWISRRGRTLFCPGIPGAGKTMMSSIVVEHLSTKFENDTDVGIAYIYCSYQPQQHQGPVDLLRSLLKQLAQRQPKMPSDIENLHRKSNGTPPSFDEVVKLLHPVIQLYARVFVIIDALDEYHDSNSEGLKKLLSTVFSLQDKAQLNLFATSRFVSEIISKFNNPIQKEIRAHSDDLLRYVEGRIPQLIRSQISDHPDIDYLSEDVKRAVTTAADGMYYQFPYPYFF